MMGTFLLVLLGTWCTVSSSQPVLTQEPSMSASLGQTVKLSCSMSSGEVQSYYQSWYQQTPGRPPRFLYRYYSSATAGSGDVSRFSASKESSRNTWYLTISNVQAEDEAVYYCAVWYSPSSVYVFGGGTYLNVLGQSPVPPKVHLFPPSQQEIESKNKATLACLVDEFYPKTIEVNWQADGKAISSGVQTSPSTKQGEKYMATSYLILSKSEWDSHEMYACRVTHDGKTFEQVVKKSDCP